MIGKESGKALMIFLNNREVLEALEDAERGQLILALLDYQEYGALPDFSGAMKMAFLILRKDVDQNLARWAEECARRSAAGKKGAAARAAKNYDEDVSYKRDEEEAEASEDFLSPREQPEAFRGPSRQKKASPGKDKQPQAMPGSVQQAQAAEANTNTNTNTNTNSNSNTNSKSNSNALSSPSGGRGREAEFARFWQAYPRKVGKQAARRAFERIRVPVEQLLSALERQRNDPQWQRENGRFIPHPVTWLSQGRWEDETAPGPQDCGAYGVECL